jgi:hypothetical protein
MLLYSTEGGATGMDIGVLTLEGERKTRPLLDTTFDETGGVFSPDGRFLAYSSNESGQHEVYVRSFPSLGGKWQISDDGGVQPVWARSGREIFYRNGDRMMAVATDIETTFRKGNPALLFEGAFVGSESVVGPYYDVASGRRAFRHCSGGRNWAYPDPRRAQLVRRAQSARARRRDDKALIPR